MSQAAQRWMVGLALGLALAMGLTPHAAAAPAPQATDPTAIVNAYISTLDPAARLNMVTDDVTLSIVPAPAGTPGIWSGKQQAAGLFGFSKSQNVQVALVGSWQVSGDRVSGTVSVTTNDFLKYNIGAVQHQYDFVLKDGKIKSFTSTMALAERPRVAAAAQAYAAAHPAPAPAPQATDPAAVVDAYLAGNGNPEAQLNMVTDDFTIRIVPPPPGTSGVWSGKAQAAGYFAFAKSQNPRVQRVGAWQVSGANVTGTVLVTVNDFLKWNVGAVQHQYEFVVQDGKIQSLTATMALSERPRVAAAAQAYAAAHPAPAPPGMPTTGQPLSILPLLGAMGLLLLTLGAAVRRRSA
jgi:hypothetical protein